MGSYNPDTDRWEAGRESSPRITPFMWVMIGITASCVMVSIIFLGLDHVFRSLPSSNDSRTAAAMFDADKSADETGESEGSSELRYALPTIAEPEPTEDITVEVDQDEPAREYVETATVTVDAPAPTGAEVTEDASESSAPAASDEATDVEAESEASVSPTDSAPETTSSAPVAAPPPTAVVTVGDFVVTMPLRYSETQAPEGMSYSQFEGPSGTVRVSSENLRAYGDLKSLSKGEECIGDASDRPVPLVLAEATQPTAMGNMKFARSTFTCPDQTYTYGYWNVEGVFAADVFYVGLHDGPFTDLTEAFMKAAPND